MNSFWRSEWCIGCEEGRELEYDEERERRRGREIDRIRWELQLGWKLEGQRAGYEGELSWEGMINQWLEASRRWVRWDIRKGSWFQILENSEPRQEVGLRTIESHYILEQRYDVTRAV